MATWDVTVTLDMPLPAPGEIMLDELLAALPAGSAVGRSAWSDRVVATVNVHADRAPAAAQLGAAFVEHALYAAELDVDGALPRILGVEALDEDETERRTVDPPELDLVSVDEAAELLQVSPQAVRARAAKGWWGAVKVGGAGWVLRRAAVERDAASKRGDIVPPTMREGIEQP